MFVCVNETAKLKRKAQLPVYTRTHSEMHRKKCERTIQPPKTDIDDEMLMTPAKQEQEQPHSPVRAFSLSTASKESDEHRERADID